MVGYEESRNPRMNTGQAAEIIFLRQIKARTWHGRIVAKIQAKSLNTRLFSSFR
jgi:hypothetical protein